DHAQLPKLPTATCGRTSFFPSPMMIVAKQASHSAASRARLVPPVAALGSRVHFHDMTPRQRFIAARLAYVVIVLLATLTQLDFSPDLAAAGQRLARAFTPSLGWARRD